MKTVKFFIQTRYVNWSAATRDGIAGRSENVKKLKMEKNEVSNVITD